MLDENPAKSTLSIVNINLIIIPLVSIIFTTIHYYNSYEFMELLVAQPISRKLIILGEFLGVTLSLAISFLIGVGVPVSIFNPTQSGLSVLISGFMITIVFASLAFLCSVMTKDKSRGIGASILVWLFFTIMYDGMIMFVLFAFSDYPIEPVIVILSHFNPVDLARIFMLIRLDVSAMMGYTGAVYLDYFGHFKGMLFSFLVMNVWIALPVFLSIRIFDRKDL